MRIGAVGTGRIGAFHVETLQSIDVVESLVVTDVSPAASRAVADRLGVDHADDLESLLDSGIDGLVVATSTPGHAPAIAAAVRRGVPVFCEKPLAGSLEESIAIARVTLDSGVPVHLGFQRRFDQGYRRAHDAVAAGELGTIHLVRAVTHDHEPPPPAYIAVSGGLFRDCNIHDFDVIRFVTGGEVESVVAVGGNKGAAYFAEADDVDTGAALLTLADGTIIVVSATRYNGAGHDVRMEVTGSKGALAVGLDDSLALTSAEAGVDFPKGPQHWSFFERFLPAYRAEIVAFTEMVAGTRPSPCTVLDGLEATRIAEACDRSRHSGRPIALSQIPSAH